MEKIYRDEEFDTLIRASLQEDPTDYDEVTARIKTKIDDEIKRKQSGFFSRLLSCMKSNGIK